MLTLLLRFPRLVIRELQKQPQNKKEKKNNRTEPNRTETPLLN
jgi:hypothetical protein